MPFFTKTLCEINLKILSGTAGQTMVSGTGQPVQIPGDIRDNMLFIFNSVNVRY